jgi:hypothetical protein
MSGSIAATLRGQSSTGEARDEESCRLACRSRLSCRSRHLSQPAEEPSGGEIFGRRVSRSSGSACGSSSVGQGPSSLGPERPRVNSAVAPQLTERSARPCGGSAQAARRSPRWRIAGRGPALAGSDDRATGAPPTVVHRVHATSRVALLRHQSGRERIARCPSTTTKVSLRTASRSRPCVRWPTSCSLRCPRGVRKSGFP